MRFIRKYKIYIIILSIILLLSIGGTIAWYVWTSTNNSSVSIAVCTPEISLIGGDTINGTNLMPVYSKEKGLKKQIEVFLNKTCKEGDSGVMNLYMKLDLLPEALQHETFIYEVVKDDEVLYSGNFKDNKEGDVITLLTDRIITESSSVYNVYVYIDGTRDNPIEMTNKNFKFTVWGEGTGAIYRENILTNTVTDNTYFLNTDIAKSNIKTLTIADSNIVPEGLTGIDISSNSDGSVMLWYTDDDNDNMLDVFMGSENGIIKANIKAGRMFSNLTNVEYLDLSNLDTSNTINMGSMFEGNTNLKEIKLSNFDTSNVTDMARMFQECNNLTSLDVSNFNTSNVTNMVAMFGNCSSLTSLDLSNFDTSNVISMNSDPWTDSGGMFQNCSKLKTLILGEKFHTQKVTNFIAMFKGCSSLISLDLSNFNTSNVTNMVAMFKDCSSLTNLDVSNFDVTNVSSMSWARSVYGGMFEGCSSLTSLDLSSFKKSEVENLYRMFSDCSSLTFLDLSNFDTSNVTTMKYLFSNCKSLISLDLSNFDTSNVTNMDEMFINCSSLTSIDLSNFNTSNVINMSRMFHGCSSLTSLDVSSFNTSNVTSMLSMFRYCGELTYLDLSGFDTSNVTEMNANSWTNTGGMFQNCSKLKKLILGEKFNTIKVTSFQEMFKGCSSLTSLDLSNFNTSNVRDMTAMFKDCSSLTSLDLSNFDVTNAITYEAWRYGGLFEGCSSLTSLDLSSFRTSTLSLQNMFLGCSSLKIINLSNFNNPNTTAIELTFNGNINLEELYLNSFDFSNITKINHPFDGVPSNVKIYVKDETQQEFIMSNVGFTIENIIIAPIVVNN